MAEPITPTVDPGRYTFNNGVNSRGETYGQVFPGSGAQTTADANLAALRTSLGDPKANLYNPEAQASAAQGHPVIPGSPSPAPAPATPFDRGPGSGANGSNILTADPAAPESLDSMIEQSRKDSQNQIDAISAGYDKEIANEREAGNVRNARTRALNVAGGLSGSDFASAAAEETETKNRKVINSLEGEKAAKIAEILYNADSRARQQQKEETAQYRQDSETALKNREALVSASKEDIKVLGSQGITAEKLKATDPVLYQQYLKESGLTPLELDSYLHAANPGIDIKNVKTTKVDDNLIMSYVDPTTKQVVNSSYNVPGSAKYDGFTIAPDGTALFYSKTTGETKIAGDDGQFGKPITVNPGKYGTEQYDPGTGTWKSISSSSVSPSGPDSSAPLFTKPTYNRLSSAGIDSALADKIGAAILQGNQLEDIRQALKTDNLDPKILDYFDNVVGIASFIKSKPGRQ